MWMLLTTEVVADIQMASRILRWYSYRWRVEEYHKIFTPDALMQLDWYATRWLIEEYHKCLKTGCAVEKRQLESGSSLVTILGFFAIVAVRLLQLRTFSRSHPQIPAQEFVPKQMLKILVARLGLLSEDLTLGEFWIAIARSALPLGQSHV
jgi:hypothetical protein